MDIENHIVFQKKSPSELMLLDYLIKHNVPYKDDGSLIVLDILSSHPHFPWIEAYMKEHKTFRITDMLFSKEELLTADWMRVRTTFRYGYPQPMNDYKYEQITYNRNGKCSKCADGLSQVDSFRLRRIPAWKHRHFFAPFWVEDEFFVSDVVKDVLTNAGITGIDFWDVKNSSGKQIIPGAYQLYIDTILEEGLWENDPSIRKITVCQECGKGAVLSYGHVQQTYHKEIFENAPDIVKTGERFSEYPIAASPNIIINQKVYRLLVEKKLDKGLIFYPLNLV